MSKWEKLLMRIQKLSNDLRFQELRRVLESYGYEMRAPKNGSSHYTFRMSYTRKNESKKDLTNAAFNRFSGGEKAMTMYVHCLLLSMHNIKSVKKKITQD